MTAANTGVTADAVLSFLSPGAASNLLIVSPENDFLP